MCLKCRRLRLLSIYERFERIDIFYGESYGTWAHRYERLLRWWRPRLDKLSAKYGRNPSLKDMA